MLKLILRGSVSQDIEAILDYGHQHHGLDRALAYVEAFDRRFAQLCETPGLGPYHPLLKGGIQSIRQGQHRIYYQVQAQKLIIIRILHVRSDVMLQFG